MKAYLSGKYLQMHKPKTAFGQLAVCLGYLWLAVLQFICQTRRARGTLQCSELCSDIYYLKWNYAVKVLIDLVQFVPEQNVSHYTRLKCLF